LHWRDFHSLDHQFSFTALTQRISDGAFIVWRITAKKEMLAKLKAIKAELQRRKQHRTTEVRAWLRKVVLVITNATLSQGTKPSCASLSISSDRTALKIASPAVAERVSFPGCREIGFVISSAIVCPLPDENFPCNVINHIRTVFN
jgi:hypothetical protein